MKFTTEDIACLRRGIKLERRAADEIERLRRLVRDAASDFEDCDLPSIGARYRRAAEEGG